MYIATVNNEQDLVDQEPTNEFEQEEEEEEEEDVGEGSSTAVRVRRVGTKRGEKLRKKEQMRQYREVSILEYSIICKLNY